MEPSSRLIALLVLVSFLTLISCSSFPKRDDVKDYAGAIRFAYKAKDYYDDKTQLYSLSYSWLGVGLIPLSIAALALGISTVGGDTLKILGYTGAAALGVGAWLQNKEKQFVYRTGVKAIQCVINNSDPQGQAAQEYEKDLEALRKASRDLDEAIESFDQTLQEYQSFSSLPVSTNAWTDAKERVAQARDFSYKTKKFLSESKDPALAVRQAANVIINAVETIRNEIETAAFKTEPDITALKQNIRQNAQLAELFGIKTPQPPLKGDAETLKGALSLSRQFRSQQFTPSIQKSIAAIQETFQQLAVEETAPDVNAQVKETLERLQAFNAALQNHLDLLERRTAEVEIHTKSLEASGERLKLIPAPQDFKQCLDIAEGAPTKSALRVSPDVVEIIAGQSTTALVGGAKPELTLIPSEKDKFDIEQAADQGVVRIKITPRAGTMGQYSLLIRDKTNAEAFVKITVPPSPDR